MEHNVYSGAHTGIQMENVVCVQQSTYKESKTQKQHNVKRKKTALHKQPKVLSPSEPDLLQTVLLWQAGMKNRYGNLALLAHMVAAACDFGAI